LTLQRPRSLQAHDKVIESTLELVAARGIEGTSVDAIASTSGVSKATIYKHWPDKEALCLEAIGRLHGLDVERPRFNSGNLLQDFINLLQYRHAERFEDLRQRMTPHLIAYSASHPNFGRAWRDQTLEPLRMQATELIKKGIEQGSFPANIDIELALSMLIGPLVYMKIHKGKALPERFAPDVARAFWCAFSTRGRDARHKPGVSRYAPSEP